MRKFINRCKYHLEYLKEFGLHTNLYERNDKDLDMILQWGLLSGIKRYREDSFYFEIVFNCGVRVHMWDTNRWYAWMSNGQIYYKDYCYKFDSCMPCKKVALEMKKQIKKYKSMNDSC